MYTPCLNGHKSTKTKSVMFLMKKENAKPKLRVSLFNFLPARQPRKLYTPNYISKMFCLVNFHLLA